jgi:hypothetical protein
MMKLILFPAHISTLKAQFRPFVIWAAFFFMSILFI